MKRKSKQLVDNDVVSEMRSLRNRGYGYDRIAKAVRVSKSTVQQYCRDIERPKQSRRGKAEKLHVILDRIHDLLLLFGEIGVDVDVVDALAKDYRGLLSSFDDNTLSVLEKSSRAFLGFVEKLLNESGFYKVYDGIRKIGIAEMSDGGKYPAVKYRTVDDVGREISVVPDERKFLNAPPRSGSV